MRTSFPPSHAFNMEIRWCYIALISSLVANINRSIATIKLVFTHRACPLSLGLDSVSSRSDWAQWRRRGDHIIVITRTNSWASPTKLAMFCACTCIHVISSAHANGVIIGWLFVHVVGVNNLPPSLCWSVTLWIYFSAHCLFYLLNARLYLLTAWFSVLSAWFLSEHCLVISAHCLVYSAHCFFFLLLRVARFYLFIAKVYMVLSVCCTPYVLYQLHLRVLSATVWFYLLTVGFICALWDLRSVQYKVKELLTAWLSLSLSGLSPLLCLRCTRVFSAHWLVFSADFLVLVLPIS